MKTNSLLTIAAVGVGGYLLYKYMNTKGEAWSSNTNMNAQVSPLTPSSNSPVSITTFDGGMAPQSKDTVSYKQNVASPAAANPPMARMLQLVQSKGTSSVSELTSQWNASRAGQAYSGVSGGVVYKVSAPRKVDVSKYL